jgi:exopolysaccharide production protein ExoY
MHSQDNSVGERFSSVSIDAASPARRSPLWKRTLDVGFILLSAPVVVPVMAFIALFIKLVSRGPVLFKQERVGYKGTRFTCYKFRSMKVNADVKGHQAHTTHLIKKSDIPMIKMDTTGDSRLIPFGSLLRASGLDELPQLLNVWKGDMGLVGPRPCVPYEYEQYLPWQKQRFNVVPGLTGLWQVSGKNLTTFNEMINLDIYYGQHASPWLDIKIIFKTIPALFELAYRSRKLRVEAAKVREENGSADVMIGAAK